jgi:hypothetical protein
VAKDSLVLQSGIHGMLAKETVMSI